MGGFERKDFGNTTTKGIRKKDREAFLLNKRKQLENSEEFHYEESLKKKKFEISNTLALIRESYPTPSHYELAPLELKKKRVKLKREVSDIENILSNPNSVNKRLKKINKELLLISEDTRSKFFIDVVKGYISREIFIEVWKKANEMYEQHLLDIYNDSLYDVKKKY